VTFLIDAALRSSVVLLAGLATSAALARHSAALRHRVLAATILAAAAVAPLSVVMPLTLPVRAVAVPAVLPPAGRPPVLELAGGAAEAGPQAWRVSASSIVVFLWAAGFLATSAILLTGLGRLMIITSRARRVRDGRWLSAARAVTAQYRLRREVTLLHTDLPHLLATWGAVRPRVLLPSHALAWPEDRVSVVLRHELAHVRRHDWLVQIAAQAVLTPLWFNPLMWLACRRLRRESEQACDDAVLAGGVAAREYAGHLLDLARQCRRRQFPWAAATPMAHPSTLERRIAAMLNPDLNRTTPSRRTVAVLAVALLAVTLPTAAFRAVQGQPAALDGSVYDPTGGVLPGVALTLEDAQQLKLQATTDGSGRFDFPLVGPGRYVMTAALPGFRALRQEFELRTARDWDRAVTLQVGDLREEVTVSERRVAASASSSQPRGPQPVRVGGNIRVPRKVQDVHPVYPPAMRDAGREGVVTIDAVIGRDGTVTAVRVLSAQVHPDFAKAAVEAVREWRFSPTLLNGSPVDVVMTVSVRFSLSD
jgi:TonB family protein